MISAADIRRIRKALGLTQPQFAQLLGVSWVTVSKWERGRARPTPYQAALIERFGDAVRRRDVGAQVADVLVSAGAVDALYLLLKVAFEEPDPVERERALDQLLEELGAPELTPDELDEYRNDFGLGSADD